ncbi:MAG: thermonuclease family protein [Rhodospirillales bacterium]|nr:thermonuclease family protein [Rhodospirillales bacterium]
MARIFILLFALAYVAVSGPVRAEAAPEGEISGIAQAIDADILTIGNQRIILWGIDAPERNQTCTLGGRNWGCWQAAMRKLQTLADDRSIKCVSQADRDPLGRIFAICTSGGVDIGEAMVKSGLARAFKGQSKIYAAVEKEAKEAKAGLWQKSAESVAPWVWRLTKSRSLIR